VDIVLHPIDLAAILGSLHLLIDLGFGVVAFDDRQADRLLPST
jgi:hypothetical protein